MLKTGKHPYKVFKPPPGVKILGVLACFAKNKQLGGWQGIENIDYWITRRQNILDFTASHMIY